MRLIDADKLQEYLEKNVNDNEWEVSVYNADWISSFIDCADTVDAVTVVHARWIRPNEPPYVKCSLCSNCRRGSIFISDYCQNCGAKMDLDAWQPAQNHV